jgi:hypothetical protein
MTEETGIMENSQVSNGTDTGSFSLETEVNRAQNMSVKEIEKEMHGMVVHGSYGTKNLFETIGRMCAGEVEFGEVVRLVIFATAMEAQASGVSFNDALHMKHSGTQVALHLTRGLRQANASLHEIPEQIGK